MYANLSIFSACAFLIEKVWRTGGGEIIEGWTDPISAPDDSYSCIACCSVQKKVIF
jgi:hypothetical protein